MPAEIKHSPSIHRPGDVTTRPKGILKNPSFSGQGGQGPSSPDKEEIPSQPPSAALNPQEAKELTLQNTLQNAGHRRSSSAARRGSASRRQSSVSGTNSQEEDSERMHLKWDEANLYLAEQESGGRMKITEPKTPFQYGDNAMDEEEEEEDVSIDPRFVNVDEVELNKNKHRKKPRETDIPGLELGEPEDEGAGAELEEGRIVRGSSLSRDSSKEKHVSVSAASGQPGDQVGVLVGEAGEKHKQFEEQRKKHYEMSNVKDLLGHPENNDYDEDDDMAHGKTLPSRTLNGGP